LLVDYKEQFCILLMVTLLSFLISLLKCNSIEM